MKTQIDREMYDKSNALGLWNSLFYQKPGADFLLWTLTSIEDIE